MAKTVEKQKKSPGPKPKLFSLYPHTFDEVLDTVLSTKSKKAKKEQKEEAADESNAKKRKKSA